MKHLKTLTQNYGLSTLVLGHTPKRDLSKPITKNDISGSKMLINFCDSAFAIGESNQDKSLRYIKQIKVRNSEFKFDKDNVAVCRIDKPENFLQFEFENFGTEEEHLRSFSKDDKVQLENDIVDLKQNNPNLSLGEIAKMLGTNKMKVKRSNLFIQMLVVVIEKLIEDFIIIRVHILKIRIGKTTILLFRNS